MKEEVDPRTTPLTLQASLSTKATMEFLKRVAAVRGRLVTSVMPSWPSGHISFRTGSELHETERLKREKEVVFFFLPDCNPLTEVTRGKRLISIHLLYMRRLKSWKSRSLFLSRKPSTEYLEQTRTPRMRIILQKWFRRRRKIWAVKTHSHSRNHWQH